MFMTREQDNQGKFISKYNIGDISSTNKRITGFDNSNPRHKNYEMECLLCNYKQWTAAKAFDKGCKRCRIHEAQVFIQTEVTSPERQLWNKYKHHAKDRKIAFTISELAFTEIVNKDCIYCGQPPSQTMILARKYNNILIYNGVDRKDNAIGYTEDNCVPCCWKCNQAKRSYSISEWKQMITTWSERINDW